MSPIPAYERDPRLTRLETDVVSAGDAKGRPFVVLADTILYPEGGGQPADRGTVGGVAVLDVVQAGGEIRHLLTAVAARRFDWHTTAFHLGELLSDIELDTAVIPPDRLEDLEEAVATEIRAARPVTARRVEPDEYAQLPVRTRGLPEGHTGTIRLVEIGGVDLNTCGGTHVASTSELEALKLLGTEPMRGGTRVFYAAGRRMRRLLGAQHERAARLRELLSTSDEEMLAGMTAKLEQLKDAQRAVRALEEELAGASARDLVAGQGRVLAAHWARRDLPFLQRVAREIERLAPDRVVLLTAGEGERGAFVLAAGERTAVDVPAMGRKVAEILGGRGGGSGRLFQGKAEHLSRRDEAAALLRGS